MQNVYDMFDDSDYLDFDYLNLQGAMKATSPLNEFLKNICICFQTEFI